MLFAVGRVASQLEASRASSGAAASTSAASQASAEHTGQVRHKHFLAYRVSYRGNTSPNRVGDSFLMAAAEKQFPHIVAHSALHGA